MIGVTQIADWMRRRRAVHLRFNPYVVGTPVFDRHLFLGRQALARRTVELLSSRSVRLRGERRIGKTSFLHHLRHSLAMERSARRSYPVFVDLEAVSAPDFFRVLMEESIETLDLPARVIGELHLSRGRSEYHADDLSHDLHRVLGALGSLEPRPVRLVFLIDEIDAVREGPAPLADTWLGHLLSNGSQELRAVMAGVDPGAHDPTGSNSWFDAMEALELGPLSPRDAEVLVRDPVASVYAYEDSAVERILRVSGLRPFAIQKLCRQAVDRMLDDARTSVRVTDVASAVEEGLARAFSSSERAGA